MMIVVASNSDDYFVLSAIPALGLLRLGFGGDSASGPKRGRAACAAYAVLSKRSWDVSLLCDNVQQRLGTGGHALIC